MLSIWRYAHLGLAILTSFFLVIASVTGIILAFYSVYDKYPSYKTANLEKISVSEMLPVLQEKYTEITEVSIDHNHFVTLQATTHQGDEVNGYIDVLTGEIIGYPSKKSAFNQWVTTLHRSLFLHETGRAIMGIVSFLLLLIGVSGVVLVGQRQGFRRFFSRVTKDKFAPFYHTIFGRWFLFPIIAIALTGLYLSINRFFVSKEEVSHSVDFQLDNDFSEKKWTDFSVFQQLPLSEVKSIIFPFSDDKEEYFLLKLTDGEIIVSQFSGEILSKISHSTHSILTELSLDLHTGRTNSFWALLLGISCVGILFFIYTGFRITFSRKSVRIKNKFTSQQAEIVILVGSENGSTLFFANAIHTQFLSQGKKSFLTELNNYSLFPNAKHLLIFTCTYGVGQAPFNANKFLKLLGNIPQNQQISCSVVGFGASSYPDFCKFAKEISLRLKSQKWANQILELHTIDRKSENSFVEWAKNWSEKTAISLETSAYFYRQKSPKLYKMKVLDKSPTDGEGIFSLTLRTSQPFNSGDLLAIYPQGQERFYSISKVNNTLQLVVKQHNNGLGSGYLHQLKKGDFLSATIVNTHFKLPHSEALFIANGTGIAPFLGMLQQSTEKCYLYAGFRRKTPLIQEFISFFEAEKYKGSLTDYKLAFSKEENACYVVHLLKNDAEFISQFIENKGVILICGSLSMYKDVENILQEICLKLHPLGIDYYKQNNQILSDCY